MDVINECLSIKERLLKQEREKCMNALMKHIQSRRNEILTLSSSTSWRLFPDKIVLAGFCGMNFLQYDIFYALLEELSDEGLLYMNKEEISLTPKGVSLLCK